MCGITGILDYHGAGLSHKTTLKRMVSTLSHRGPDAWGTYLSPYLAFGHTRLSILDLQSGDQPMMTDRYVIVYNGEVFNYVELRKELESRGIGFTTQSDTEVVIRCFDVYGEKAFSLFNGQFAIALWDRIKNRLIIARDRYGIRPFFILKHKDIYYFSSEMKAFDCVPGFHRTYEMENLFDHALLWNTLGDSSVYRGIRSLPPGSYEIYELGRDPINKKYYELGESIDNINKPSDINAAQEEFNAKLELAVDLRLRSDVPVGAYISGGIDSSVIAHLISLKKKEKLQTFSIAFEDKDFDESDYQREMVKQLNVDHNEITVDYKTIDSTFLDTMYHVEQPIFRTAPVPLYLLSKEVRKRNVKVVLTGEGADEILFGYDSFKELKLLQTWRKDANSSEVNLILGDLYPHLKHYSDPQQMGMMRMFYEDHVHDYDNDLVGLNIRVNNNKVLERFFRKEYAISFSKDRLLEKLKGILPTQFSQWSLLQRNQCMEMKTLLAGYLLSSQGDRMSLAHGVEGRYPFLDFNVVELLFSYPDEYKLNGMVQKFLLKDTYKNKIPASIIRRPKRPYMAPDLKSFFANGLLSEKSRHFLSDSVIKDYGIFDERSVQRFLRKFSQGVPENIGYRDNMIITFLLSAQMASYWSKTPKNSDPDPTLEKVAIEDF